MMNKQEVIKKINNLEGLTILDKTINFDSKMISKEKVLNIVKQLDEPEKPVVPQFVADFYESIKDDFEDGVYGLCAEFYEEESELSTELYWWFKLDVNKPIETLVKMKLYGYEVEKEQMYTAKLKLTNEYLGYESQFKDLIHYKVPDNSAKEVKAYHFTEDDLVKYHIWGNDSYEINEVKE